MKMMKTTCYLALLFLAPLNSMRAQQAYQPLLEANRFWEQLAYDGASICTYTSGEVLFLTGTDTVIGGNPFHRLAFQPVVAANPNFCPPLSVSMMVNSNGPLLREDTAQRKVFYYTDYSGNWQEELLFDFSLAPGDTLQSAYSQHAVVDSVGTIQLLDGSSRRIWYFPEAQFYIEGIGGSQGLYGPMILGLGVGTVTQCVRQGSTQLYGDGGNCIPLLSQDGPSPAAVLTLFPNPAKTVVHFQGNESNEFISLSIFNNAGMKVWEWEGRGLPEQVEIEQWPAGIYFVQMNSEGNVRRGWRLVKE